MRATRDVDLLITLKSTSLDTVLHGLAAAGIRPKRTPPVLDLGSLRMVQLGFMAPGTFIEIQIDLLLAEAPYQEQALSRRMAIQMPDLAEQIFVLSCEDFILHKLIAGQIIDRADAVALIRLNQTSVDRSYLDRWVRTLGLQAEFLDVWREASPGNPFLPG